MIEIEEGGERGCWLLDGVQIGLGSGFGTNRGY